MGDEWGRFIARLVEANGGNQSRTARLIGVPQQRVGSWMHGARPDVEHLRMVARVTEHSLPYLLSVAYDIPLDEVAEGAGGDLLRHDDRIAPEHRDHIVKQYGKLKALTEFERASVPPPDPSG
jgi:transcriptional regulator with XRE-family HTH domain